MVAATEELGQLERRFRGAPGFPTRECKTARPDFGGEPLLFTQELPNLGLRGCVLTAPVQGPAGIKSLVVKDGHGSVRATPAHYRGLCNGSQYLSLLPLDINEERATLHATRSFTTWNLQGRQKWPTTIQSPIIGARETLML